MCEFCGDAGRCVVCGHDHGAKCLADEVNRVRTFALRVTIWPGQLTDDERADYDLLSQIVREEMLTA